MADITLENIATLLQAELDPIKTDLTDIKHTLAEHTAALDALAKNVKLLLE